MTMNAKKIAVFTACLVPLALMIYQLFTNNLGAEPVHAMLETTGTWALRLLLVTLAITPIRRWFGVNVVRYRRMLGLFVMFYATLHLLIYVTFDFGFDVAAIIDDALRRKFIFVGLLAFLLLIPLTITSTKGMMKRLGNIAQNRVYHCCTGGVAFCLAGQKRLYPASDLRDDTGCVTAGATWC